MHHRRATVLLAAGLTLCLPLAAHAQGPPASGSNVTFAQLTSTTVFGGSQSPSLDASGDQVAFQSNADLTGSGEYIPTEVFFMNVDGTNLVQLTNGGVLGEGVHSSNPWLNASGQRVVFGSNGNLTGQNSDGNGEIFFMKTDGSGLAQVTDTLTDDNFLPVLDFAGKTIVFSSNGNLIPGQNSDGSVELFKINSDGTGLVQVTQTPFGANSSDGKFSASGKILFGSDGDWLGTNPYCVRQLFMLSRDGTEVTQLTFFTDHALGAGANETAVDAAFLTAAFSSFGDPVGQNADLNSEIFLLEVMTGQVSQLTATTGGRGCVFPSLSADGRTVAFNCDRKLIPGLNTDENSEIFLAVVE